MRPKENKNKKAKGQKIEMGESLGNPTYNTHL